MKQLFCIVSMPRTGSSHLCSLLHSHPSVVCHSEIFHKTGIRSEFKQWERWHRQATIAAVLARNAAPLRFLDTLIAKSHETWTGAAVFGFKLFPYHNRRVLRHVCTSPDYKIIHLTRHNKLLQYASDRIARTTGQWSIRTDRPQPVTTAKVRFAYDDFARFVETHRREEAVFQATLGDRACMSVDYSELESQLAAMQAFIGVAPSPDLVSHRRKQNPDRWSERYTNPETVAAALEGTAWEEFLAE